MTTQTEDDLRKHLDEQLEFIKTSADLYDQGKTAEAKRLAVSIRVLVHDTSRSISLLSQLGIKDQPFVDTALERPQVIATSYAGLVGTLLSANSSGSQKPNLDSSGSRLIPFDDWWGAPVIIDFKQREISRKRLVLAVANQDGGAHIDPELDDIYADLSRTNSMSRMYSSGGSWKPIIGVEHASVRQVAHEVMRTFDREYVLPARTEENGIIVGGLHSIVTIPSKEPQYAKVGRNETCPCGSGRKYKKCHGAA